MKKTNSKELYLTPARQIPISTRSITGELMEHEFESTLERDLIMMMAWENDLDRFQVQPVTIRFKDSNGKSCRYTPDLLVYFQKASEVSLPPERKPLLCEVKYKEDLLANWKVLKPKFQAARAFARKHGWEFKIYTEDRIRTSRLKNIQFLWSFRHCPIDPIHQKNLVETLRARGTLSINGLLNEACTNHTKQVKGEAIAALWCLIATKVILCDMNTPLSMTTNLKLR